MKRSLSVAAWLLMATSAAAQTPLAPALQGLGFLVGHWSTPGRGKVAETGGSSAGDSDFTPDVNGAVLLRRDHVRLYDAGGRAAGGFEILMMIYAEGGAIHAEYADGQHIIHYTSAVVDPGHAVTFATAGGAGVPRFRLRYTLVRPNVLDIAFAMAPPGSTAFHPIASGSVTRQ